jgi:Fur family transcriptional regulator, zinc uptake regulator
MPHNGQCHEHAHDPHSRETTRERFLERLKVQGFKLTGKRKSIVEILLEVQRYISAKDLLERMKEQYPRLSFDTVYRNLHMLKEESLIEESTFGDGGRMYRITCDAHDHHHHYICTICGKTELVEGCPMDVLEVQAPTGFHIQSHRFEIFGECADCATV